MTSRFVKILAPVVALSLAACAGGGLDGTQTGLEGDGSAVFGIDVAASAASSGATVKAFVIRLFKDPSQYTAGKPFFESGCSPFSKGFSIGHIAEGDDYVVQYLGYSDKTCSKSSLLKSGVRGGVRVTSLGTGDAYYFIQINTIGEFSPFPVPNASLNPETGGVTCLTDSDCRRVIPCEVLKECPFPVTVDCDDAEIEAGECPDGTKVMQYNVHPKAVCDDGICRLETLFPLNTRGNRAFATSVATDSGDVVTVGGFTAASDGVLQVDGYTDGTEAPETFMMSGDQAIFEVLETDRALGPALAMSAGDMVDSTRLVVAGGTSKAGRGPVDGISGVPFIDSMDCSADCAVDFSPYVYVIDTATGETSRAALDSAIVPSSLVAVYRAKTGFYVRAGAAMSDDVSGAANLAWSCNVSDANGVSCSSIGGAVSRLRPAGVCIARKSGLCSKFLTVGGTATQTKFAEIYDSANDSIRVLTGSGDVPEYLVGAVAFMAGDELWTIGGTSDAGMKQAAVPYKLTVDEGAGTVVVSRVAISGADAALLARVFHQVTVLSDDSSVLVTGGTDMSGAITKTAVLLEAAGGSLNVVDSSLKMSVARSGHSATLVTGGLYNGAVLVTGGLTGSGDAFATGAEIYMPR